MMMERDRPPLNEKNDVFVGNLTFNTTEDQLRKMFAYMGPVKNVRILADKETGKSRGFAFVEYYDANAALSAIRHLDGAEVNGRKIKVSFPSQSSLKDVAKQIGQLDETSGPMSGVPVTADELESRQQKLQKVIGDLKLHEAWDILEAMKKLVMDDKRGVKVRSILSAHPQLINAMYEIQKRLGIVLPAHIQQQQMQMQEQQQQAVVKTAPVVLPAAPAVTGKIPASAVGPGPRPYHHQPYGHRDPRDPREREPYRERERDYVDEPYYGGHDEGRDYKQPHQSHQPSAHGHPGFSQIEYDDVKEYGNYGGYQPEGHYYPSEPRRNRFSS